jgi:hypothetical protein
MSLPKSILTNFIGMLSVQKMNALNKALFMALDLKMLLTCKYGNWANNPVAGDVKQRAGKLVAIFWGVVAPAFSCPPEAER